MKDGGRAFPVLGRDPWDKVVAMHQGMSLRDWFAGQAIAAFSLKDGGSFSRSDRDDGTCDMHAQWAAEQAYRIADALLKAREPASSSALEAT